MTWTAQIRAISSRWLTDRALIERETVTIGALGDAIREWETVASDVPCRVIIARRSDLSASGIAADREMLTHSCRIVFPAGTSVGVDMRVTVDGEAYHIVRVEDALTDDIFTQVIGVRE